MNKNSRTTAKIYSDGGSRGNPGPSASGFWVEVEGRNLFQFKKFLGNKTNNWAEYYAIYLALLWIFKNKSSYKFENILYNLDSELAVKQLNGEYKVKSPNLKSLFMKIKHLQKEIGIPIMYKHVPREQNSYADKLVNQALDENC